MKKTLLLLMLTCSCAIATAQERSPLRQTEFISADSLEDEHELLERVRNMPNLEVGKGITFRPKSNWFSLTMRFRMQNMVGLSFDKDFTLTKTDAQVKRLRLRFDGYIYSPKLVYSVQLGFTSYDTEPLPNGNMNIVRDAIVYYVPSPKWNIGFGQTKIKANRARINSSSALQFVDRSIVNSEFNLDRDFGFFGEYNMRGGEGFNLSAKGSVTLGEGRNWGSSSNGGLAYTGRLELYPLGRFKSKGDVMEGDFEGEEQVKILVAGAYSYNHKASRLKGQRGASCRTTRPATSAPILRISSSSTGDSHSIPISWDAAATDRCSTPRAMPSYTAGRGSTYRPATCSTRNGRSPCVIRRSSPSTKYNPLRGTNAGTRRP